MLDGHFDYGNGYHGRVYLNPHQLFRHPSTIWRFAQDLLDVLPARAAAADRSRRRAGDRRRAARAHDRRPARQPPQPDASAVQLRAVQLVAARRLRAARLLRARDRGQARAAGRRRAEHRGDVRALRRAGAAGGRHRGRDGRDLRSLEAIVDVGVPNIALAEYKAPENFAAAELSAVQGRRADHAF